jgi:hypothetical protein
MALMEISEISIFQRKEILIMGMSLVTRRLIGLINSSALPMLLMCY